MTSALHRGPVELHSCGSGRMCRDAEVDPNTGWRKPVLIDPRHKVCIQCERAMRSSIRALADDYFALGALARDKSVRGQLIVSMTPDPAMPLNGHALALQNEVSEWAEAAMVLVSDALALKPKVRQKSKGYPVRQWPVVNQAERVLPANFKLLLDAEAKPIRVWQPNGMRWDIRELNGIDVAVKMMRTHAKVKGFLGEANPRRRLAMPCPVYDCGMPTLGIDNGETDVTCTSCGGHWSELEYDWLSGMLIGATGEREINVLRWLLAEKAWQLSTVEDKLQDRQAKLDEVSRLLKFTEADLVGIDGYAVVEILKEILT